MQNMDPHKMNLYKNLNIFHSNVNGLETKFDNLHEFLSCSLINIDFVSITETSQTNNENFIRNVDIGGYDLYSTARGGTAIYVNNKFNSFERNDIKIINDEFESVWIELNNKEVKTLSVVVYIV